MTTGQCPTTATVIITEEDLGPISTPTPIPSFREAMRTLRDWAIQTRYDAGFSDSPYGLCGSLAASDLKSLIDEVRLAFKFHDESGEFPPSLVHLRARASQPGVSLRAEIVRDAISCAITEMSMATAVVPADNEVAEKVAPASVLVSEPLDVAWEQVTRALGTIRKSGNEGWVKVSLASEQFRQLSFIESVVNFPPGYQKSKTILVLAQSRHDDYIQFCLLEPGLRALAATVHDARIKSCDSTTPRDEELDMTVTTSDVQTSAGLLALIEKTRGVLDRAADYDADVRAGLYRSELIKLAAAARPIVGTLPPLLVAALTKLCSGVEVGSTVDGYVSYQQVTEAFDELKKTIPTS